jgi:hypothetical protein
MNQRKSNLEIKKSLALKMVYFQRETSRRKETNLAPNKRKRKASTGSSKVERLRGREFNPDYSYIIKDLRRILTLATFFIIVLIILSFILN